MQYSVVASPEGPSTQKSYEPESKLLKRGYMRDYVGEHYILGVIKGDTRSLDHGSYTRPKTVLQTLFPNPKHLIIGYFDPSGQGT